MLMKSCEQDLKTRNRYGILWGKFVKIDYLEHRVYRRIL